jgi:hypothetical protein
MINEIVEEISNVAVAYSKSARNPFFYDDDKEFDDESIKLCQRGDCMSYDRDSNHSYPQIPEYQSVIFGWSWDYYFISSIEHS